MDIEFYKVLYYRKMKRYTSMMNEGPINVKNSRHKFLQHLQTSLSITVFEEVLVDIVNKVGVDINHAVANPYYHCHYIL